MPRNNYIHEDKRQNKYTHSKTSLNRPVMGPTLSGPFKEVVDIGSYNIVMGDGIGRNPNKTIDIREDDRSVEVVG